MISVQDFPLLNLDSEIVYLFFPCGLGDLFVVLNILRKQIEEKYGKFIPIILKNQQCLMKILGIKEYLVIDIDYSKKDSIIRDLIIKSAKNISLYPEKGKIFFCHPSYCGNTNLVYHFLQQKNFIEAYCDFLKVNYNQNYNFLYLEHLEYVDKEFYQKNNINLNQITIILPEANSINWFDKFFWEKLALKNKNVFSNKCKYRINNCQIYDFKLDELIYACSKANKVISIRSGICDFIQDICNNLEVIFPRNTIDLNFYSIQNNNRNNIKEISV